jgi:hypothetical protein
MSKAYSRMISPWYDALNWRHWLRQRREGVAEDRLTEIAWILAGGRK